MARLALWLTSFSLLVGAAVFSLRLLDGYFLADDFAQLASFARWDRLGLFGDEVMAKFASSIDGMNGTWGPLTYMTFALNHLVNGADAWGWLAVNLVLHAANAALVAALVLRLHPEGGIRPAAFAAVLFYGFPPGWEAVLWISSRYDTLSTFFVLLAAWWFAGRSGWKALFATALALMSKESGSVAFVIVGMLALAREIAERTPKRFIVFRLAQDLWPFVLLGLAYVALRIALFGSATGAYAGVSVDLASAEHWARLAESGAAWARANFPGPPFLLPIAALAAAALLATGLMSARRSPEAHLNLLAVLASLVVALLLVARFVPEFDAAGLGGRLFYLPGAIIGVALGLALGHIPEPAAPDGRRRLAANLLSALLLVGSIHWMWRATGEYRAAHGEMRVVAEAVGYVAAASPSPPALLIIPDTFRRAAFGRNAQAGLMLPPVQRAAVSDRVLVQTDAEIPQIGRKIARGLFDWLPRHSILDYPEGTDPLPGTRPVEPSKTYCWSSRERRFVPLDPGTSGEGYADALRSAYAAAGCG